MSAWRILQIVLIVATITLIGLWIQDGLQVFTKDKSERITLIKDDIFGTTVEKREWVDDFQLGLLPDDPMQPFRSLSFFIVLSSLSTILIQRKIHQHSNQQ
ncbi:MAG: hypothetical protein EBU66_03925 [Bacteroidetes bacterium]|nr:hypothetical protein [bacterium]NBP63816.1 hypothetical protein [Bacteroidota bacterium]